MNQQRIPTPDTSDTAPAVAEPNGGESRQLGLPNEINQKLERIDGGLDELRAAIESTNRQAGQGLARLAEGDLELGAKVSETYTQLGELDALYQDLAARSEEIGKEIGAVSRHIKTVSRKSDAAVGDLASDIQGLNARTQALSEKSRETAKSLRQSIQDNAKVVESMAVDLVGRIESLAESSRERDEALAADTAEVREEQSRAGQRIEGQQARMLRMQAVDQALETRTASLEATARDLGKQSQKLSRATTELNKSTQTLAAAIEALELRAAEHESRLDDLDVATEASAGRLAVLAVLQRRHLVGLSGAILVVLVLLAGYVYLDGDRWHRQDVTTGSLSQDLSATRNLVARSEHHLDELSGRLTLLDQQVGHLSDEAAVNREQIGTVTNHLVEVREQVDAIERRGARTEDRTLATAARLDRVAPARPFGTDSTIRGPDWVRRQAASGYLIHLATVDDRKQLYRLAQRYAGYFTRDLAYAPVGESGRARYALLYGAFDSDGAARAAAWRLPQRIEFQQPVVRSVRDIQRHLGPA